MRAPTAHTGHHFWVKALDSAGWRRIHGFSLLYRGIDTLGYRGQVPCCRRGLKGVVMTGHCALGQGDSFGTTNLTILGTAYWHPAAQIGQRKGRFSITAKLHAQQRIQGLILNNLQYATITGVPLTRNKCIGKNGNFTKIWFHIFSLIDWETVERSNLAPTGSLLHSPPDPPCSQGVKPTTCLTHA